MANYSTLKAAVANVVKTNGEQAITGANLQTVLLSIINSIGGGGYIFEGVATPSTDAGTPDQNVFYIGGAGTYANFGTSVVVPLTNIAVFKYNGSWTCEQVMVENGGVFDISAYHATGGTLATYADLAAALGTGGANVPEGVRKGGMSIKFVQSSDNKYIQARCIAQNFTTDVTQWQGVDKKPTAGNENLVESGGIDNAIDKVDLRTRLVQRLFDAKRYNFYITSAYKYSGRENGELIIPMDANRNIGITLSTSSRVHQLKSVPNNPNYGLQGELADLCANTTYKSGTSISFTTAADIKYLQINIPADTADLSTFITAFTIDGYDITKGFLSILDLIKAERNRINVNDTKIENTYDILGVFGSDRSSDITYISGKKFDTDGTVVDASENYLISNPVEVKQGDVLIIRTDGAPVSTPYIMVCATDANGSYHIPIEIFANNTIHYVFVAREDGYISFSSRTDYSPVTKLFGSSLMSDIVAFIKGNMLKNKYFIDAKDALNRVAELYLTGLDPTKEYYFSSLGKYTTGGNTKNWAEISERSSGTTVARINDDTQSDGIVTVSPLHSSGISGYAILHLTSADVVGSLVSGNINVAVVSDIDNSPAIKTEIGLSAQSGPLYELKNIDGTDYVNMFDSIEWNQGQYLHLYHYGLPDADVLQNCRIANDSNYNYAKPFFMKKGDILSWDGGVSLNSQASTCAVAVTDESGHTYNSILNLIYLGVTDRTHYRFVADRDMWVSCNVRSNRCTSVYLKWYRSKTVADVVDNLLDRSPLFPFNEYVDLLEQCKKKESLDSLNSSEAENIDNPQAGEQTPQLVLIHMSDVHNDYVRINRMLMFKQKYGRYIDDAVLTGDITGSRYSNIDKSILSLDGWDNVLTVIGNHDVYDHNGDAPSDDYSNPAYWATQQEKYELWMMGKEDAQSENNNIAGWGVIQPTGAGQENYYPCYYYKDYTDMGVRMIVLDCMDIDGKTTQLAWFNSVLADAKTNGMHVLIAEHFAPRIGYNDTLGFNTGFHCLSDTFAENIGYSISEYTDAIDDFIDDGGVFICWLCGHFHWDQVATLASHPKQMYIAIASGSIRHIGMQHRARIVGQENEDLFNIVAIDTFRKHVRVARVGSKFDRYLQHAGTMCISYNTTGNNVPHLLSSW